MQLSVDAGSSSSQVVWWHWHWEKRANLTSRPSRRWMHVSTPNYGREQTSSCSQRETNSLALTIRQSRAGQPPQVVVTESFILCLCLSRMHAHTFASLYTCVACKLSPAEPPLTVMLSPDVRTSVGESPWIYLYTASEAFLKCITCFITEWYCHIHIM